MAILPFDSSRRRLVSVFAGREAARSPDTTWKQNNRRSFGSLALRTSVAQDDNSMLWMQECKPAPSGGIQLFSSS
jgi:hypothetical protein